ncbi:hypothetical protein AK812_SmicGene18624 [Symbiodinium microadriaticum]|uniref:Uncharacterized protein n=1 Tax=Symbiodinium microadriaticum TaxID=2951 RepID=A0A1Q9DUM9_SYMMI|nr:hypothetical protein AK812_SmicGene18624 [Symbiodinium microadriaticum]
MIRLDDRVVCLGPEFLQPETCYCTRRYGMDRGHDLGRTTGWHSEVQQQPQEKIVLRKVAESPDLEYALVLEDEDCALGFGSADEVRRIFNDEMRSWPVYLGGSISSYVRQLFGILGFHVPQACAGGLEWEEEEEEHEWE